MNLIKRMIRKIVYHQRCDSFSYISYINKLGGNIDPSVTLYNAPTINIDEQYPCLIHIGKNVNITEGVTILTHDYSWSVSKGLTGAIFGAAGEVVIGANVFVGRHAIILKGVHIGDNSIIGAGAVVSKDVPANEVWGGNPARKICSVQEFTQKREQHQIDEAYLLYKSYVKRFHKNPSEDLFFEFISLFLDLGKEENYKKYKERFELMGNADLTISYYRTHQPRYQSFSEMILEFSSWYQNEAK